MMEFFREQVRKGGKLGGVAGGKTDAKKMIKAQGSARQEGGCSAKGIMNTQFESPLDLLNADGPLYR